MGHASSGRTSLRTRTQTYIRERNTHHLAEPIGRQGHIHTSRNGDTYNREQGHTLYGATSMRTDTQNGTVKPSGRCHLRKETNVQQTLRRHLQNQSETETLFIITLHNKQKPLSNDNAAAFSWAQAPYHIWLKSSELLLPFKIIRPPKKKKKKGKKRKE